MNMKSKEKQFKTLKYFKGLRTSKKIV